MSQMAMHTLVLKLELRHKSEPTHLFIDLEFFSFFSHVNKGIIKAYHEGISLCWLVILNFSRCPKLAHTSQASLQHQTKNVHKFH